MRFTLLSWRSAIHTAALFCHFNCGTKLLLLYQYTMSITTNIFQQLENNCDDTDDAVMQKKHWDLWFVHYLVINRRHEVTYYCWIIRLKNTCICCWRRLIFCCCSISCCCCLPICLKKERIIIVLCQKARSIKTT